MKPCRPRGDISASNGIVALVCIKVFPTKYLVWQASSAPDQLHQSSGRSGNFPFFPKEKSVWEPNMGQTSGN